MQSLSGHHGAIEYGALGICAASREVSSGCWIYHCWVHKIANVSDKMPKSVQHKANGMRHEMEQAPTKKEALAAYQHSVIS
jgi:putative transposase